MIENNLLIYTDGACSGNPGPGGFGAIIITDIGFVKELGESFTATTNNRMEMMAVIKSFEYLLQSKSLNSQLKITVYTDSVYVIRGITQWIFGWKKRGWKNAEGQEVTNQDLWRQLDQNVFLVSKAVNKISWEYVRGHIGVPGNERCDEIAVAFSKNDDIDLYAGSAANYLFDVTRLPALEGLPEMKSKGTTSSTSKKTWYLSLIAGKVKKYETWKDCEADVKGRPGVKFKKVTSESEENEVLKSWGAL